MDTMNDQRLIDRIVYLASLVSDPQTIDPLLDVLRAVTARIQPGQQLAVTDQTKLAELEDRLKQYLVTSDPIRSFSPETLQAAVDRHFSSNPKFMSSRGQLIGLLLGVMSVYIAGAFLIPGHPTLIRRLFLAAPLPAALLNCLIAWFFWSARRNFAKEIRRMYGFFSVGAVACAVVSIQMPLLFALPKLRAVPAFGYIAFLPPFIFVFACFYMGMYLYARKLALLNWWGSAWLAFAIPMALAAGTVLAYYPRTGSSVFFDLSVISNIVNACLCVPSLLLARKIAHVVTRLYAQSVRLFAVGMGGLLVSAVASLAVLFHASGPTNTTGVAIICVSFIVPEIYILASAYVAKRNATGEDVAR